MTRAVPGMLGALRPSAVMGRGLIDQGVKSQMNTSDQSVDRALLMTAIFAIPIGLVAGAAKMLLLYLATIAEPSGWTVSATQPELADATGTTAMTVRESLYQLKTAGVVRVAARLFRGHGDARASRLRDGGHVMALGAIRILRLARDNQPAPRTRFQPVDERALAQWQTRARAIDAALARLRHRTSAVPKGE